ncbi:hypothetical protein JOQ06_003851, partial [Pogonophryne albipinna]
MCMNSTQVWQALQAFDSTRSGLVAQDVLRAILSSFIFPMNPHSFQKLTSHYGVSATGPLRWKHFLGHFMSPVKVEGDTNLLAKRASEPPVPEKDNFQDINPRLKRFSTCTGSSEADPQHIGYIAQEDLKKLLSSHGIPISERHFNKLCETSSSRPGSSSKLVYYPDFLENLGVPLTYETCPSSEHTERRCTSPQSTVQSVRAQRPASCLQVSADTCNILDIVFQRMRSRLEQRHSSLPDRIKAITHGSNGTLSEKDIRKILEDSWVILDDTNFHKFTELLGLRDGRIERSVFLEKYAAQCLAAMKTRIKSIHGNNLSAFRLMDRKRNGVVDCRDFKELYSSLGFFCREAEYQRLLELIGLQPGGNLNYAEFVDVVENNGKKGTQTAYVPEQLHELLACEAHYTWADMSKVLCQYDTDGRGWIHKKRLRGLLFTYALPIRSEEFDQLWLRYDPEGQGRELRPWRQKLNQAAAQQSPDRPGSSDAASLECIEHIVQENFKELSDSLAHLETGRDGTVTVEQLLSLLQTYSSSMKRQQLEIHLRRLNVTVDDNRLAYMDFLYAFDHKKSGERPPASPDAERQKESLDGLSPAVALARMQELVTASAPHKAFSAFDQRGTGTVKPLEFRQYRHMLTKLQLDCETCTVNWKDFLNTFQSESPLISERCLSKNIERRTTTRSPTQTKTPETTKHNEENQQIQDFISGHLYEITKKLMDLKPSNSTTRLTNDQIECVWSQMPVNEQKKLQYRDFLELLFALGRTPRTEAGGPTDNVPSPSCEPREAASATKSCSPETTAPEFSSRRPSSMGRPGTGSPPGSRGRGLRAGVQRCWKEIQRNCAMEDPQREGHISTTSFLKILHSLGINMTQEQLEHLTVKRCFLTCDRPRTGSVSVQDFRKVRSAAALHPEELHLHCCIRA